VGDTTANDTSLAQTTPPALPASSKAEILAEAALARDAVFADYDTIAQQLIDLDADVAESQAFTASSLAEARADLQRNVKVIHNPRPWPTHRRSADWHCHRRNPQGRKRSRCGCKNRRKRAKITW